MRLSGDEENDQKFKGNQVCAFVLSVSRGKNLFFAAIKVLLKRGGIVVPTEIGFVQFGIPPETIKDSLLIGSGVPRIFVVPGERFDSEASVFEGKKSFATKKLTVRISVLPLRLAWSQHG